MSTDELNGLALHDVPLDALVLDFDERALRLRFSFFDEANQAYQAKELAFHQVQRVELSAFTLTFAGDGEVAQHRAFVEDGQTGAEFLLMDGLHQQSFTLRFLYRSCALE
jgi:hypothetical protein